MNDERSKWRSQWRTTTPNLPLGATILLHLKSLSYHLYLLLEYQNPNQSVLQLTQALFFLIFIFECICTHSVFVDKATEKHIVAYQCMQLYVFHHLWEWIHLWTSLYARYWILWVTPTLLILDTEFHSACHGDWHSCYATSVMPSHALKLWRCLALKYNLSEVKWLSEPHKVTF